MGRRLRRVLRACATALALGASVASATTITVDSLADDGVGCTLRNAVTTSNDNAVHGTCAVGGASNTIIFSVSGTLTVNSPPINIYQHSLTFQGNGIASTVIDGQGIDHVFDNFDPGVPAAITLTWQDLTIKRGNALSSGPTAYGSAGAIFIDTATTVVISNCVFSGNHAESSGGAIENRGTLTITGSTFDSNVAAGQGGAITSIGALSITDSTFSNNAAGIGGAVWHSTGGPSLAALNSTFAGNSATTTGGAISADDGTSVGPITLTQVTVAGNASSAGSGGGVYNANGAAFSVDRTIIAANSASTGPDCAAGATTPLTSLDYNVFGSLGGCTVSGTTTHNLVAVTPLLGTLANNGGPTQTVALQDGSPAIDIIPAVPGCATAADQRGVARPIGAGCDPGAFEAPLPIVFTPTTLAPGQVAAPYSQAFTGAQGVGPYTFAVTVGALPAGLSLSPAGLLSGTPTAGGVFNFTITVTDTSNGRTGSHAMSLTIGAPTIAVSPATLPSGTFGIAYSQSVSASGGTAPYTFTVTVGSTPTGVGLSSAGVLSGTPTSAGTFNFTITATDSSTGTGPFTASQAYSITIAAVLPGAPIIGVATAGDAQATVAFSAPLSNGGSAITGYTATANPGGATGTSAGGPITVAGLANGTAYTFTVTATNGVGTGPASAASNSVTPKAAQTITFANPGAQSFGTTPTLAATASSGLAVTFTSTTTGVCTITSGGLLTFVTSGTCTINADQAGNGTFSAAPTVPQSFTVNAVVPGAPVIGTATAGDTQATVAFSAPASIGGSAITGYTATANPGGATGTGAGSPITVSGLTNGTAYTFTVTATNSAGTGPASAPSNSVTPKAAQTITFANPGAQNFGTTPTLSATASSALAVTFTSSTSGVCTITSGGALTFVAAGTCTINADQAGNGSFLPAPTVTRSFTVNAVLPGAPVIGVATAGNAQATISFAAPASNGGSAITAYHATCNPGGFTATGAGSPLTVAGLTNGTLYTCSVTATNAAGMGPASASVTVTPILVVTSFTGPSATGTGSITASFAGGGATCSYTVTRFIPLTGDPASPPAGSAPQGVTFPHGLFDFTTSGCTPGSTITLTITYPAALAAGTQYWKYGPTPTDSTPHWYVLPAAISGSTVTFAITDGGLGDDDLAANGGIVDQGGPGFGGGGGIVPVPTLSEWATLVLALLLGLAGFRALGGPRPAGRD